MRNEAASMVCVNPPAGPNRRQWEHPEFTDEDALAAAPVAFDVLTP